MFVQHTTGPLQQEQLNHGITSQKKWILKWPGSVLKQLLESFSTVSKTSNLDQDAETWLLMNGTVKEAVIS